MKIPKWAIYAARAFWTVIIGGFVTATFVAIIHQGSSHSWGASILIFLGVVGSLATAVLLVVVASSEPGDRLFP